jgi:hypothetical protein
MQEDWVLCRVFEKKKGDNEHDTTSTTSHVPSSYNPMLDQGIAMNDFYDQISLGFSTEVGNGSDPFQSMPVFQQCNSFDTSQEYDSVPMMGLSSMSGCGSSGTNDHGIYYDMISNLENTWFPMWHQG